MCEGLQERFSLLEQKLADETDMLKNKQSEAEALRLELELSRIEWQKERAQLEDDARRYREVSEAEVRTLRDELEVKVEECVIVRGEVKSAAETLSERQTSWEEERARWDRALVEMKEMCVEAAKTRDTCTTLLQEKEIRILELNKVVLEAGMKKEKLEMLLLERERSKREMEDRYNGEIHVAVGELEAKLATVERQLEERGEECTLLQAKLDADRERWVW